MPRPDNVTCGHRGSAGTTGCSKPSDCSTPPASCPRSTAVRPPRAARRGRRLRQRPRCRFTAHGVAVPIDVAKGWLDPEARAILVLMSNTNGIVAHSDKHRLFTEQQRLAMFARDKGCSYWGCDAPIAWTQAHHVTDYAITRRTSVDDGALACTANHATFERMG